MTTKKLFLIATYTSTILAFSACDDIKEPDRYIEVIHEHSEKRVLLQEFTGTYCSNCPDGARIIEDLHNAYGDNFITMGLHPQGTIFNTSLDGVQLTSEIATFYYNYYQQPKEFPCAVIDGTSFNGNIVQNNRQQWGTCVTLQMSEIPPANIKMTSVYTNPDIPGNGGNAEINVKMTFSDFVDYECNVVMWIVENDIHSMQLSNSGVIPDYIHNHVLRCAVNGEWGQLIGERFIPEEEYEINASITLNPSWIPENCQIIGALIRNSDKVVLQAAICDIISM